MSGRKGLGVKADDLVELLLERSRAEVGARRSGDADAAAAEMDARAIAIGALRLLSPEGRTQQGHRLRLRRGPQLRRRHRSLPPIFAGARGQHLPQAGRKRASPRTSTRPRFRTTAGTTSSGPSSSTRRRLRTSPNARSRRSSSPRSPATHSGWPRSSTTFTTGSRSPRSRIPRSGTAASPRRVFFGMRCLPCSASWASRSRAGCDSSPRQKAMPRPQVGGCRDAHRMLR